MWLQGGNLSYFGHRPSRLTRWHSPASGRREADWTLGVHAPDLYDGKTFTDLNEGVGYAKEVGFGTIAERGRLAADGLPNELVYAGFSLGVMPAIGTCSLTTACRTTTRAPRRCSSDAPSHS
jgi:hypothetical protein